MLSDSRTFGRKLSGVGLIAGPSLFLLSSLIDPAWAAGPGRYLASSVVFLVGTLLLVAIVVLSGEAGKVSGAADVRLHYLIGGVLGAAYVTTVLLTVRTLGAGGVTAATVAGQLTMSVIIDRLGVLGLDETPITATRVLGVLLLFVGTLLVIRT